MSPDDRALAALPIAAALVCAVHDGDRDEIARLCGAVDDWPALVVVLADLVPPDSRIGDNLSDESVAYVITREVCRRFDCTIDQLRAQNRDRHLLDARAVAMAAMRYAGLTSVLIGRWLERDHSTVLYAVSRVGESSRLRRIARQVASLVERGDIKAEQATREREAS